MKNQVGTKISMKMFNDSDSFEISIYLDFELIVPERHDLWSVLEKDKK